MEQPLLIDSNVYIALMRSGKDPVAVLGATFPVSQILSCGIVKAEVLRGVKLESLRMRLDAFFDFTRMIPTTAPLWNEAWQLASKLDRLGRILPLTDIVIACCALKAGAAVVTHDRHFDSIPGLRIIRP